MQATSGLLPLKLMESDRFTLSAIAKGAEDGVYEGEVLLENANFHPCIFRSSFMSVKTKAIH